MKTSIKQLIAVLLLTGGVISTAHASNLTCESDNMLVKVSYGEGSPSDDLITLQMESGSELTFVTNISSLVINTRCGEIKTETAKLFISDTSIGTVNIKYIEGSNICETVGKIAINIDFNGENLDEHFTCY